MFPGHCDLYLWFLFELRAYLYIILGRNPKFGVRIYFGIMACLIHFWVNLTCSLYISMYKNTANLLL